MYVCMYVCVCIYIYIYTHTHLALRGRRRHCKDVEFTFESRNINWLSDPPFLIPPLPPSSWGGNRRGIYRGANLNPKPKTPPFLYPPGCHLYDMPYILRTLYTTTVGLN